MANDSFIKTYWNKILNIGVRSNLSPVEFRQIQTINGLCIVGLTMLFILFFVNIVFVGYLAAMADVVGIFGVIIPTWYLNYRGRYVLARGVTFYSCITLSMMLAIYNAVNDRPLYTEIIILAMAPAAILFFEKGLKNFSFFFAVACYLTVFFIRLYLYKGNGTIFFFNIDLVAFAFSICYGLANIHKNAYNATQKIILDQNEELRVRKREIEEQAKKLADLNQLKDKFLGIISHDLRAPLNSFQLSIDMLRQNQVSAGEFELILKMVSNNVMQTRGLLDSLLFWARGQINGTPVKPTIVNIHSVIQQVVKLVDQSIRDKQMKIIWEADQELRAWADPENILLVLRNLLTNAIKFSEVGDKIIITAKPLDSSIQISVEDFGIGISAEQIQKVFTTQVQSTSGTLDEKGTGLGLMLCREFVERNGGQIVVNSIPNQGSIFSFTVPRYSIQYN